jgi:N,N'-diacetyllegionaminate synthase
MNSVIIGEHVISENNQPFIIAEAGINHNGDLTTAFKMIDVAVESGVNAVKFQTFKAEQFCGDPQQMFTYNSQGKQITEPMLDMFKRMEFTIDEWRQVKAYCDKQNIMFLSTPQNPSDLELLLDIGIDVIKVGSDDFNNIPLLKSYKKANLPMILSCGMADLSDVFIALEAVGAFEGAPIILCLCTSQYPTPPEDINLEKLRTLKAAFPMLVLGFSDHSQGALASSLAVTYGAALFEKHFTLDHNLQGPDHWFSENPISLKQWRDSIHQAYVMKGSAVIRATEQELSMRTLARRSIVAITDINPNDKLTDKNIGLRRPGDGLPPILWDKVVGFSANKVIKQGTKINFGDFIDS